MRTPCKHLFDWVQIDYIQLNCALYFWCKHLFYWVQIDWAQLNSVWLNMPAYLHISSRNCRVLICDYAVWFLCANWRMNNVNIRVTLFGNNFTFVRLKLHIVGENGADFRQNIWPDFFMFHVEHKSFSATHISSSIFLKPGSRFAPHPIKTEPHLLLTCCTFFCVEKKIFSVQLYLLTLCLYCDIMVS